MKTFYMDGCPMMIDTVYNDWDIDWGFLALVCYLYGAFAPDCCFDGKKAPFEMN
jgi:hypothetical protein